MREKIFQRFWRADTSRTRDTGGTGLGLAIVAGIVAAHHGDVEVVETPGGGATFRVSPAAGLPAHARLRAERRFRLAAPARTVAPPRVRALADPAQASSAPRRATPAAAVGDGTTRLMTAATTRHGPHMTSPSRRPADEGRARPAAGTERRPPEGNRP